MAIRDDLIDDEHNKSIQDTLEFKYEMIPEERRMAWQEKTTGELEKALMRLQESYQRSTSDYSGDPSFYEDLESIINDLHVFIEYRYELGGEADTRDILSR